MECGNVFVVFWFFKPFGSCGRDLPDHDSWRLGVWYQMAVLCHVTKRDNLGWDTGIILHLAFVAVLAQVTVLIRQQMFSSNPHAHAIIVLICGIGFMITAMARIPFAHYYLRQRPRSPSPKTGHVHPLSLRGAPTVFLTEREWWFYKRVLWNSPRAFWIMGILLILFFALLRLLSG